MPWLRHGYVIGVAGLIRHDTLRWPLPPLLAASIDVTLQVIAIAITPVDMAAATPLLIRV